MNHILVCRTFLDNDIHGRGTFIFAGQNAKYTGEFRKNKKHGVGIYEWANGNRCGGGVDCIADEVNQGGPELN